MGHVFISYARSSAGQAEAITAALRALGHEVWRDDIIPAHRPYADVIQERLDAAAAVLVLWSREAAASQWVRSEADRGRNAGKLVQARLDGTHPPMPFDQIQCADLSDWTAGAETPAWRAVIASVADLLSNSAAPAPKPAQPAPPVAGKTSRRWRPIAVVAAAGALVAWLATAELPGVLAKPPPQRSIAILPIQNLTGDPALDPKAQALTEGVVTALGRGGGISVANRARTQGLRRSGLDDVAVGRRLRVRYVVDASLREADPGYRVSYLMIDTLSGKPADSGDVGAPPTDDEFPGPRLALALFDAFSRAVNKLWIATETARPPNDHDPASLLARFQALAAANRQADIVEGERLIAQSRTTIPTSSPLRTEFDAAACYWLSGLIWSGYDSSVSQRDAWGQQALAVAAEAVRLTPTDSAPHACRAGVFGLLGRWDEGEAEARYVIETAPLTANGYEALGDLEFNRGRFAESLAAYKELDQRIGGAALDMGETRLFMGDTAGAIADLRRYQVTSPSDAATAFFLAAALQAAGRHQEAVVEAAAYRRLKSDDRIWRDPQHSHEPAYLAAAAKVRAALRAAGLEEPAKSAQVSARTSA